MILKTNDYEKLRRRVGGGPLNKASIVVFGNEEGTAVGNGDAELTIQALLENNMNALPLTSIFLQFVSRFTLARKYNDDTYFDKLNNIQNIILHHYIMYELYRTDTAVLNLRPLPQGTDKTWQYSNINEKDYYKQYNFNTSRPSIDTERINILKTKFDKVSGLILGSGEKRNKKAFFEYIYPNIEFKTHILSSGLELFVCTNPKIILSNYYSSFRGIGLKGLKEIYHFAEQNRLV